MVPGLAGLNRLTLSRQKQVFPCYQTWYKQMHIIK